MSRPRMLFIATRFPLPADSGGQIRTVQVLRGLKGGAFEVTLLAPASPAARTHAAELESLCDRYVPYDAPAPSTLNRLLRLRHLISATPIAVGSDRSRDGLNAVRRLFAQLQPDIVVVDFPHAAVLVPSHYERSMVLFAHNVEAEIFERHVEHARGPLLRTLWRIEAGKMDRFERRVVQSVDGVIAVSERDAQMLRTRYGASRCGVIRTGVDLDYFTYGRGARPGEVVFTGSMDWLANAGGIEFFLDEVWGPLAQEIPHAHMSVVGRNPPAALVEKAARAGANWTFTGRVEDVRPYVRAASAFVIPLQVGGGTRLKVFEAMALGCPVVSTSIGVEGLPVEPDKHYLRGDTAAELCRQLVHLLRDADLQARLARAARDFVEASFSGRAAARDFEACCLQAMQSSDALAVAS